MTPLVIALALSAAVLHATWNAFLRGGGDRLQTVTLMSVASTVLAIPFVIALPLPALAVWPYILASAVLQTAYSLFLVAAYRHGALGQVYPIVRGTVPVLVTLSAVVFAAQRATPHEVLGVLLIAGGIASLALGRARIPGRSLAYALCTGAIIAAYATIDSLGVRMADGSNAYTAWVLVGYGILLPLAHTIARGRLRLDMRAPETWRALAGGAVAVIAYAAVVAAFARGPAGPIAALRETSVLFATLIGWLFLGEKLSLLRVLASATVAVGAICLIQ
ncbi:DMT family transporter [Segnochrobactrum spirostomi]|uniref:EamA family transporter n=1 Tax=Segnochrobactrum spirostomi TaxID=2608987 RepID=A0A6A7YCD4_9HYPH|nr:DMT family transporter [Segnochrobactrum spirostomi]MQT15049.1 EamA family transporter [Segnochrobactrum spirostomi]